MAESFEKQAATRAGFIRAYGLFWSAADVDWTGEETEGPAELLGRRGAYRGTLKVVNFWDQRGIYVLYNEYGAYYVGRTEGENMGLDRRLRQHHYGENGSPHAGKWDRFSWFGWRGVLDSTDRSGYRNLRAVPRTLLTDSKDTVGDIEALLMTTLGTVQLGNKRKEKFAAALRWEQVLWHERDDLHRRLGAGT